MLHVDSNAVHDASTILENVGWLIDHLDEHGLREVRDVPILELAKHISVTHKAAA